MSHFAEREALISWRLLRGQKMPTQATKSLHFFCQCPWRPCPLLAVCLQRDLHREWHLVPLSTCPIPVAKGAVSCRPRGSFPVWCCTALGTSVLVNGLNTVCFIFQQVLWLKAWYASFLFLLSVSFCAVLYLFQLSVCARTIWHGSPARQCLVLSRGKIINHNLDGEGVRDWFYLNSRADGSTGR